MPKYDEPRDVTIRFAPGKQSLRYSALLRFLRRDGMEARARVVEHAKREVGDCCPVHGHLEDPVVATVGDDKIAFICPHCSDAVVAEAWRQEGAN